MAKANGSLVRLVGVRWQLRGDSLEVTRDDGPRCETCKWWLRHNHRESSGECRKEGEADALFAVEQDYVSGIWLHTKSDFGCIQWEAKE